MKGTKGSTRVLNSQVKSVLDLEIEEDILYRPKTKETQSIYEELLAIIHRYIPDQSQITKKGVLDVILAVLKSDDLKDKEREKEAERMLGCKISQDDFQRMFQLSRDLVDYGASIDERKDTAAQQEFDMPIEFGGDEDGNSQESDIEEEYSDAEEKFPEDEDQQKPGVSMTGDKKEAARDANKSKSDNKLDVGVIDGYWLQSLIRKYFDDTQVLEMESQILNILKLDDRRQVENKLVGLLKHQLFDVIKLLIENRYEIYYLTRLGQAQSEDEKEYIRNEMSQNPEGQRVLSALERSMSKKDDKLQAFIKEIREGEVENAEKITDEIFHHTSKKVLDLEELKFNAGSHLMSNNKIKLPEGSFRTAKKGYDEVYIPPAIYKPKENEKEISIHEIPDWMHPAFQMVRDGSDYLHNRKIQ